MQIKKPKHVQAEFTKLTAQHSLYCGDAIKLNTSKSKYVTVPGILLQLRDVQPSDIKVTKDKKSA